MSYLKLTDREWILYDIYNYNKFLMNKKISFWLYETF